MRFVCKDCSAVVEHFVYIRWIVKGKMFEGFYICKACSDLTPDVPCDTIQGS